MRLAHIPKEETCQALLLKMRDDGLVKCDIHSGRWFVGWAALSPLAQDCDCFRLVHRIGVAGSLGQHCDQLSRFDVARSAMSISRSR
jgi:hypothetical protein